MKLTTGATLQSNKYVIQELLNQSDFGVTYQAIHIYLDQTVFLQTLNEVVRPRSDFAQLQQQFMAGVRWLVKDPATHPIRVLDCFEEDGIPFVVLEFTPGQPPPKLSDWLTLSLETTSPEAVFPAIPSPIALTSEAPVSNIPYDVVQPEAAPPEVILPVMQTATIALSSDVSPGNSSTSTLDSSIHAESLNPVPRSIASLETRSAFQNNGATGTASVKIGHNSSYFKPKRRLPVSLIVVSLIGGFVGAGAGLALRLSHEPEAGGTIPLFSREQSFPPEGNWPISEDTYVPDFGGVEQPIYRTSPPSEYGSPEIQSPPPDDNFPVYSAPYSPDADNLPSPEDDLDADVSPDTLQPKLPVEDGSTLTAPPPVDRSTSDSVDDPSPSFIPLPDAPIPIDPVPVLPPSDGSTSLAPKPFLDGASRVVSQ
ncbi:MAG: hypothetical protein HC865_19260 [Cyanobacteria bacterium RU_5_0]|nr:hypothetical protein [Cyanobacteria bacterium RU_5_0]